MNIHDWGIRKSAGSPPGGRLDIVIFEKLQFFVVVVCGNTIIVGSKSGGIRGKREDVWYIKRVSSSHWRWNFGRAKHRQWKSCDYFYLKMV